MTLATSLETTAALISPVAPVLATTKMSPVMEQPTATTPAPHTAATAIRRRQTKPGPIVRIRGNAAPRNVLV